MRKVVHIARYKRDPRGRLNAVPCNFVVLTINQCKAHANIYFHQFNSEIYIWRLPRVVFFLIYGSRHVRQSINISDKVTLHQTGMQGNANSLYHSSCRIRSPLLIIMDTVLSLSLFAIFRFCFANLLSLPCCFKWALTEYY